MRPRIVCLCGSTRFSEAFKTALLEETLKGKIVLTVGSMTQSDVELQHRITPEIKAELDKLHLAKVELADEVLILNVDGYVGDSTFGELAHAIDLGKDIVFLEPDNLSARCTMAMNVHNYLKVHRVVL